MRRVSAARGSWDPPRTDPPPARNKRYADSRATPLEAWRIVFDEDVAAVDGLQRGRTSPGYGGGVQAPDMDQATHHVHAETHRGWSAPDRVEGERGPD